MGRASEPRSGRYLVALAFEKAIVQRSRAAFSFGLGSVGAGVLRPLLAQMYLDASLPVYLGEFIGRAAGVAVEGRCAATGAEGRRSRERLSRTAAARLLAASNASR